jgi:hypothetical protein
MTGLISGRNFRRHSRFIGAVGFFFRCFWRFMQRGWAEPFLYNKKSNAALKNFFKRREDTLSRNLWISQLMMELGCS